jgi:RNA polymerase sigma factor (sigma-70 family)
VHRTRSSDEGLLVETETDPEAFGAFYTRHEAAIVGFFRRTLHNSELAVDLAAETFARALESRAGFDPARGAARAWLFGIAHNLLADSIRRGRVESASRERLGMSPLVIDDRLVRGVDELVLGGEEVVESWLEGIPEEQREAVRQRVLNDRSYGDIAAELQCSEAVVRQRVSRGLSFLRRRLREET